MALSLLVVVFVVAYAFRGWRRGLVVEVVELVALVAAILLAWLTWPLVRGVVSGWAAAVGGTVVFLAVLVGGFLVAAWAGRQSRDLAPGGRVVDGVGGSLFAAAWSLLLVTALLILSVTVPGARLRLARPVCDAPIARGLLSAANPLHVGGERLAALGRPVLLWINQQLSDGITLSHAGSLCDDLPSAGDIAAPGVPGTGGFTFPPAEQAEIAVAEDAEQEILRLLNAARSAAGLAPLAADAPLRAVGRRHSRDMYLRGYFAHETPQCRDGPDTAGCTDPFDRIRAAGIGYALAGENLALAPTPAAAHAGLMESPGHRANILNADYTRVGIGVYRGPYGLMVSQEFAG